MTKRSFDPENFLGTEFEGMTEEEIIEKCRKYVPLTINKRLPYRKRFMSQHGLENDDLEQYGLIGLMNAIRSYKPNKSNFETFAINYIMWEIPRLAKEDSLYNLNKQTFELANLESLYQPVGDTSEGDDAELINYIPVKDTSHEDFLINETLDEIKKHMPEKVNKVIDLRMKDLSLEEIGDVLGVSKQAVSRLLLRRKSKIKKIISSIA